MKLSFSPKPIAIITLLVLTFVTATATLTTQASATAEWQLTINGQAEQPLTFTLSDLKAMPQTVVDATIYCVDFPDQVVTTGKWTGVSLAALLQQAGVQPSTVKIAFYAADQYATDLDLVTATQGGVIVAYAKDGEALSETLRLVVPGKWGYKWISQLTTITLMNFDFKGKWESQGYSDDASVQSGTSVARAPSSSYLPNPNQANTTIVPSSGPQPSNSSTSVPSQNTQDSKPEPQLQPQNPWVAILAISGVASVVTCASLLIFVKRRRLKTPS